MNTDKRKASNMGMSKSSKRRHNCRLTARGKDVTWHWWGTKGVKTDKFQKKVRATKGGSPGFKQWLWMNLEIPGNAGKRTGIFSNFKWKRGWVLRKLRKEKKLVAWGMGKEEKIRDGSHREPHKWICSEAKDEGKNTTGKRKKHSEAKIRGTPKKDKKRRAKDQNNGIIRKGYTGTTSTGIE